LSLELHRKTRAKLEFETGLAVATSMEGAAAATQKKEAKRIDASVPQNLKN